MKKQNYHAISVDRRQFLRVAISAAIGSLAIPAFAQTTQRIDVYKDESCGCCANWIDHMQQHGFDSTVHHPRDLTGVKNELGVLPALQSCHTAVTESGFVFEGHVPARHITQFLASPPADALGLAVPGMPMGSRGMEMGNNFSPYDVVLMKKDGTTELFASIKSAADQ